MDPQHSIENVKIVVLQTLHVTLYVCVQCCQLHVHERCVTECLHTLQSIEGCPSVQELFKRHVEQVLQEFEASADSWSLCSPERFIFEAILTYAGTGLRLLHCY
jgi:hypothetical protein